MRSLDGNRLCRDAWYDAGGPLSVLDPVLTWLSGVSTLGLAISVLIFAGVIALGMLSEDAGKLDSRTRGIVGKTAEGRGNRAPAQSFRDLMRRLATQSLSESGQQKLMQWLWEHSSVGQKRQMLFKQAGMRAQRVYLYFEIIRFTMGAGLGFVVYRTVVSTGLLSINPALAIVVMIVAILMGLYVPELYLKRRITARRGEFAANWDDAIGLLIICLDAGLSIEVALRRIARELAPTAPVLAEELTISVTDLTLLAERRLAYMNLSERIDLPSVKSVTVALIQSEKQGASIANSLRTISQANRQNRISRAEEKAAALGPKMTVPMIVFFLPVVFVIIIAPVVLSANL